MHTPRPVQKLIDSYDEGETTTAKLDRDMANKLVANARLIAAAPDLLAACETMHAALTCLNPGKPCGHCVSCRAGAIGYTAIAKAKGEAI